MASYLDRLITLDEEGTENLDTSFEAEQTQDITEVIDVDTNNDEINAEAVSIEEDLEAMQDGTEAVGELAEQESVNDELLESPGDISPEVAKATNDAFKVTLAGLAIDVRDTVYGNITYDSNRNEPIEVVRITNDGVKDFLSKIKEHIIAFFRTVKAKLQKLIAKFFIMFSDVSKKGEALHKQLKNKLDRLKNKQTSKGNKAEIDVKNHETKIRIIEYMPMIFFSNSNASSNGTVAIKTIVEDVGNLFGGSNTLPIGLRYIEQALEVVTKAGLSTFLGKGKQRDAKEIITLINKVVDRNANLQNIIKGWKPEDKKDYETSDAIVVSGFFSKTATALAFRIHEDSDTMVPSPVWVSAKIKQEQIDNCNITEVSADEIKEIINTAIKIGRNSVGICKAGYKHLEDIEKELKTVFSKLEAHSDGDYKAGEIIKWSSVIRSITASVAFKSIMDQAKAGRRVLALANYLYNQLDEDFKDAKKEDKRK